MLFAVLVGAFSVLVFLARSVFMKLKFLLSAGKADKSSTRMKYAIFSEGKRYWTVFKPICDEFEKRGEEIYYLTCSEDDPAFSEEYTNVHARFIGQGNKAFLKLNVLKTDVVLSTTPGLDVYQWKRSRDVKKYVHVLHSPGDVSLYRMFGLDYYDVVMVSGESQRDKILKLEEIRNLPAKELPLVGITYLDELRKRFESAKVEHKDKVTILLAPSWGPNAIFTRFGGSIIEQLLKTDFQIIIRPHPQSFTSEKAMIDGLLKQYPESERLHWDRSSDNFDSLMNADVLISDFSGIILDFVLVFDRPVIYTQPSFDKSIYDAWWIEEDPWTFDALKRIGRCLDSDSNLEEIIHEVLSSDELKEERKAIRQKNWVNIGKAAESIVDYCIKLHSSLQPEKGLSKRRKNNKRGELA